ncbi:ABC transporter ATP-binding protein [Nocardiopsis sp. NPDC006198]|uniref:ABC transporter ATP-binding protein n=1 Tax=Nocardiopsis sp. NPDC006198 TaxID=3154472 RepID=UPI0033ACAC9F
MSLPVADAVTVRRYVRGLIRSEKALVARITFWFVLATACGLAVPALVGSVVDAVSRASATTTRLDLTVVVIICLLLLQGLLIRHARFLGAQLGEKVLARIREEFITKVLSLPLSATEKAGTGDLLSRSTNDVQLLSHAVRIAAPTILVASLSVVLTLGAILITSPLMILPCLIAAPVVVCATRWYLRRSRPAYLSVAASNSALTQGLIETVTSVRTVEALGLADRRIRRTDTDVTRSNAAERSTLFLRSVWYSLMDFGYILPVALSVLFGGLCYLNGWLSLGQVVTAVLYSRAIIDPLDELVTWLDELQVGDASLARLIGVHDAVTPSGLTDGPRTDDNTIVATDVSFAYRQGHDVLQNVSLRVRPGERVAIVGPSGAGKSTFGKILAGIHVPRSGSVDVGGTALHDLPLDQLRRHVALVTQEHYVFTGTILDNVTLAKDDITTEAATTALDAVNAMTWVRDLPDGLVTVVGSGGVPISPGRAQQLALARLVLANPHTLVLDEATSLMDPGAARQLERSLAAVLKGRTVIAIAHRLHTAHDADTVVVMDDGRITEQGSHDELVAAGGAYARLWDSWHSHAADAALVQDRVSGHDTPG